MIEHGDREDFLGSVLAHNVRVEVLHELFVFEGRIVFRIRQAQDSFINSSD